MPKSKKVSLIHRIFRCLVKTCLATLALIVCIALLILIWASFISTDHLYDTRPFSEEVELQLMRMQQMIHESAVKGRLDIYTDYTEICGEGIEWNFGFYTFYALCLEELVKQDPSRAAYAAEQIDLCTRLMLQLPIDASDEAIETILEEAPEVYKASLVSGYQCLVLGIRHALVGDTLYDNMMRGISDALDKEIQVQLQRCGSVYTSDQSTQLHAIWRVDQALGTDRSELFKLWMETMQAKFIDPKTGLLHSMVSINPDRIDSIARATSVAWSIIFLADIFPEFTSQQYVALNKDRVRRVGSLAAAAEFSELNILDFGDMDSGPMLIGISPAATGFILGTHKLYGTPIDYTRTYRIFEIFGLPKEDHTGKYYRMGNGMGDAILLYSKIVQPR